MIGWLLAAAALAEPAPAPTDDQTLVYYNARMALREGEPAEALQLWLLRNAIGDRDRTVSAHDPDFASVVWAATGALGLCQDGLRLDDQRGAGLWPLALHNWVVGHMGRRAKAKRPRPFEAFQVGQQQRFVSLIDVLDPTELRAVKFRKGRCMRQQSALLDAGEPMLAPLNDRYLVARLLQHLLRQSRTTLAHDRVRGRSAVDARLFDVYLQIASFSATEARRAARDQARRGRALGLSREAVAAMGAAAASFDFAETSEPGRILRGCADWPVAEWMALSADRRRFLFEKALAFDGGDPALLEKLDAIALGVVDQLAERREGEEVARWIGLRVSYAEDVAAREAIWGGARGEALLALDRDAGFAERAVVGLHRGVRQLEAGDLPSAMRSLAYAIQYAPESAAADDVRSLARRWLSYVASQFEITDELLVTLRGLLPRGDYAVVLEDLLWRAAFHADGASFQRGLDHQLGRDALSRRLALLAPLARGDLGRFATGIADGLQRSPSETLRLLDQLVQRLELEDADVRAAQVPTLQRVRRLVAPLAADSGRGRVAAALVDRILALEEGSGAPGDGDASDRARALLPGVDVYAGSVRLAPADPLPWPFAATQTSPPSVFEPIALVPEEWRDEATGDWVFGWRVGG
ncbi:MAG: hypothetical protein R3F59_27910 [Myxococcota bacterium]